jgi:hypothetical protein
MAGCGTCARIGWPDALLVLLWPADLRVQMARGHSRNMLALPLVAGVRAAGVAVKVRLAGDVAFTLPSGDGRNFHRPEGYGPTALHSELTELVVALLRQRPNPARPDVVIIA